MQLSAKKKGWNFGSVFSSQFSCVNLSCGEQQTGPSRFVSILFVQKKGLPGLKSKKGLNVDTCSITKLPPTSVLHYHNKVFWKKLELSK
jgi:hypothetical protein